MFSAICGKRSPTSAYVFAFAASKAVVATVAVVADVHKQRHVASLIPKQVVWIPLFHVDQFLITCGKPAMFFSTNVDVVQRRDHCLCLADIRFDWVALSCGEFG